MGHLLDLIQDVRAHEDRLANLGEVAGTEVEIVQETNYPWDGTVKLTVNPKAPKAFAVRIRVPKRDVSILYRATPNGDGITKVPVW